MSVELTHQCISLRLPGRLFLLDVSGSRRLFVTTPPKSNATDKQRTVQTFITSGTAMVVGRIRQRAVFGLEFNLEHGYPFTKTFDNDFDHINTLSNRKLSHIQIDATVSGIQISETCATVSIE